MFNEQISLPDKIDFTAGKKENEKILTIEPFYQGYGITVGNALRRVLLSSLVGAAVTSVKIKGVEHEFSTIKGVKEDVVDIILNLKKLKFKLHTDEPVILSLKAKGAKIVTASNFEKNSDVEVATKDLPIATLTDKTSELIMEVTIEKGRGYDSVEDRKDQAKIIGTIAVDAAFSPVIDVSLNVSEARVGQEINYDKLTMAIQTDGTITPDEALKTAAMLLVDHFGLFVEKKASKNEKDNKKK